MKLFRPLICAALSLYALAASAQWQWIDKSGHKVFSDLPPPAEIPDKNILRRPGGRSMSFEAPVAAPPPTAAAPAAGVDKGLNEKKKQAEAAEGAKRKAEEDRNAQIRADNCARAQQTKAGLDVGGRMTRINERGEREYLDESAIAAEQQRLQAVIYENCR
jgi:hypothetical protein